MCHSCRENVSEAQYALAVMSDWIDKADALPLAELAIRLDVDSALLRQLVTPKRISVNGEIVKQPAPLQPTGRHRGKPTYNVKQAREMIA